MLGMPTGGPHACDGGVRNDAFRRWSPPVPSGRQSTRMRVPLAPSEPCRWAGLPDLEEVTGRVSAQDLVSSLDFGLDLP